MLFVDLVTDSTFLCQNLQTKYFIEGGDLTSHNIPKNIYLSNGVYFLWAARFKKNAFSTF